MKRLLFAMLLIANVAHAQNVYLVHGSGNFNINSVVFPVNTISLNVYKDSLNVELDLAAVVNLGYTPTSRVVITNRGLTYYYVDGVHVTTLAQLRTFYNSYMTAAPGGGSVTSVTAGTGLTATPNPVIGAGTISMPSVGTAGSKGSASQVPVFTTDAQGRVSANTNTTIAITSSQVSDIATLYAALAGATFTGPIVVPTVSTNAQSGTTYTFVLGDAGKTVSSSNAAPTTFTIPPNASVAFAVGTVIYVSTVGAGKCTLAPGAGVSIVGTDANLSYVQYGEGYIKQISADVWLIGGKTAP